MHIVTAVLLALWGGAALAVGSGSPRPDPAIGFIIYGFFTTLYVLNEVFADKIYRKTPQGIFVLRNVLPYVFMPGLFIVPFFAPRAELAYNAVGLVLFLGFMGSRIEADIRAWRKRRPNATPSNA